MISTSVTWIVVIYAAMAKSGITVVGAEPPLDIALPSRAGGGIG